MRTILLTAVSTIVLTAAYAASTVADDRMAGSNPTYGGMPMVQSGSSAPQEMTIRRDTSAEDYDNRYDRADYSAPDRAWSGTGSDSDLARLTYRAVDRIVTQAAGRIRTDIPLLVGTISDVTAIETSSAFGRMVTEQAATRIAQKGYPVKELKLRDSVNIKGGSAIESGEFLFSHDTEALKKEHAAGTVLTGTYARGGDEILVNLKLMDVQSGHLLGATDFVVERDSNVDELLHAGSQPTFKFYGKSKAY